MIAVGYDTNKSAGFLGLLIVELPVRSPTLFLLKLVTVVTKEPGSLKIARLSTVSPCSKYGLSAPTLFFPPFGHGIKAQIDLEFMMWQRLVLGLAPDKNYCVLNVSANVQLMINCSKKSEA